MKPVRTFFINRATWNVSEIGWGLNGILLSWVIQPCWVKNGIANTGQKAGGVGGGVCTRAMVPRRA